MWRPFSFFTHEPLKGPVESLEFTATCLGRGSVIFGDVDGVVKVFDRSGTSIPGSDFQAYSNTITHMKYMRTRNILITIGDDDAVNTSIVRVWDLDKRDTKGRPTHREHRLFSPKFPAPTETIPLRVNYNSEVQKKLRYAARGGINAADLRTCVVSFDVSEDLQHMAIALTNDDIIMIKGDLEKERTPKIRRIRSSIAADKLTFVGFPRTKIAEAGAQRQQQLSFVQLLYAVHEDHVVVWRVTAKGDYLENAMEPQMGASYECAALNEDGQLAVAAKGQAEVAFFGGEQFMFDMANNWDPTNLRALAFAVIEGDKRRIAFHKNYLTVLAQNDRKPQAFTLQAYDPEGKIRALNNTQSNHYNVAWVLTDVNEVIVISQDAKVIETVQQKAMRLTEMDTQAKLEQLFKKDMYDEAKRMAKRLGVGSNDTTLIMDIQRRYGDHMYSKGKYKEAIDQYIEAIGFLEPSYVIRRFLDAQRIVHLTRYLEELHHERHKVANKNHTTLLLNCYTKLRDEEKLKRFIRRTDIRFDAHNAIKVCRQAQYFESAIYLAEYYNEPNDYVRIQLENMQRPSLALSYIRRLPVNTAEEILKEHGKELIEKVPDDATDTLIDLCTEWKGPARRQEDHAAYRQSRYTMRNADAMEGRLPDRRSNAKDFIHVFVDSPAYLLKFLESVVRSGIITSDATFDDESIRVVYNTLIELYLTENLRANIKNLEPTDSAVPAYQIPNKEARQELCMRLLMDNQGKYDPYHALALVQQHKFDRGILFMLQTLNLFSEIFIHHAKRYEESTGQKRAEAKRLLIQTCYANRGRGNEEQEREMWISLLSLLVRGRDAEDITRVLSHIEEQDILPPVAVIQILSQSEDLELQTVREYVLRMLQKDTERIEYHQKAITQLSDRVRRLKGDIRELHTSAVVFQTSKCAACSSQLDLPAVHFLCKHSFHQRCLNDPRECNICAAETRKFLTIQKELDEKVDNHDEFFKRVGSTSDGFSVVAEYFGKGIFSAPQLKKEALLFGAEGTFDDRADGFGDDDDAAAGGGDDDMDDDEFGIDDDDIENLEGLENW